MSKRLIVPSEATIDVVTTIPAERYAWAVDVDDLSTSLLPYIESKLGRTLPERSKVAVEPECGMTQGSGYLERLYFVVLIPRREAQP